MIRIEQSDGWILIGHQDHARLAGGFARHWGNSDFASPEPWKDILVAVSRHDDAWAVRDANPFVTREGKPGAFSHELVGSYTAFEEIDLADYLKVRGGATEAVAADNPYAAIIVSMHTVNLLTEQADVSGLAPELRLLHRSFVERQRERQRELAALVAAEPGRQSDIAPDRLQRAFEFLQVCDSLSLVACVRYPRTIPLRHKHPSAAGNREKLECTPVGPDTYRIAPYPFDEDKLSFKVPCRRLSAPRFADQAALRAAYVAATPQVMEITIVR